jgi:hypothetical protein
MKMTANTATAVSMRTAFARALRGMSRTIGAIEHSNDPKLLANTAKHLGFSCCGDFNLYGIVDAQIAAVESELLRREAPDEPTVQ